MKKLLTFALSVGLLAAFAGEGAAATSVKSGKSNSDLRETGATTQAGGVQGKDLCVNHKGDRNKYAGCERAVQIIGGSHRGGGTVQRVTVCSGGYWWTIESMAGPITQGGPCSPDGAIK